MAHFVDDDGNYIGEFINANPPQGAREVPSAPPINGTQKWLGDTWGPDRQRRDPKTAIAEEVGRLDLGKRALFWSALAAGQTAIDYGFVSDALAIAQAAQPIDPDDPLDIEVKANVVAILEEAVGNG